MNNHLFLIPAHQKRTNKRILRVPKYHLLPSIIQLSQLLLMLFPDESHLQQPVKIDDLPTLQNQVQGFLKKVSKTYFPVSFSWSNKWDSRAEPIHPALKYIPLEGIGVCCCEMMDPDEYREPIKLLLHLEYNTDFNWFSQEYPNFHLPSDFREQFHLYQVGQALSQMNLTYPLDGLPHLINLIQQTTGNFWFDSCPACWWRFAKIKWHPEAVQILHTQWLAAQELERQVLFLLEWTTNNPHRLQKIFNLLKDTHNDNRND